MPRLSTILGFCCWCKALRTRSNWGQKENKGKLKKKGKKLKKRKRISKKRKGKERKGNQRKGKIIKGKEREAIRQVTCLPRAVVRGEGPVG